MQKSDSNARKKCSILLKAITRIKRGENDEVLTRIKRGCIINKVTDSRGILLVIGGN